MFSRHAAYSSFAISLAFLVSADAGRPVQAAARNLAKVAQTSTSFVSGHETITALNDGFDPKHSDDKSHGAYGNWPRQGTQWVQYEWSQPISTGRIEIYWFDDARGVRLPKACRLAYWDGHGWAAVKDPNGLGLKANQFNVTTFADVETTRLRLEIDSAKGFSTGILDWRVIDTGRSPDFPPTVKAGVDRVVVAGGKTHLLGLVQGDTRDGAALPVTWSKQSGPGVATIADPHSLNTTAQLTAPGEYELRLTAGAGKLQAADTLHVSVVPPPNGESLHAVTMRPYTLDSRLWNARIKNVVTHWIPHCYTKLSDPKVPEGGIENFVEAGKKLAGQKHGRALGAPWSNAYVHNTVESMCWALMVDARGDAEIVAAQTAIREKLADWIPKILAAQEPDGYLQTFYTLGGHRRWTNKGDHEGYTAGYFIESAVAHYLMTNRTDDRMYSAARRLADCWYENIGPAPKRRWYDGHEELEQALLRLAALVDETDGAGAGRKYRELTRFLLDSRGGGEEYDQSHVPVVEQYEAVGHAVRASYLYAAMAEVALETRDIDYQSAVQSLWSNLVHKKYYVTGGIGSGETSEGFGPNFSLPNNCYCESCSNCGELFFQHKLNLGWRDARCADLYEDTIFNAILGDVDLEANNFTYTNSLDSAERRYAWHGCPCCVGNIPRALLMLPVWTYATGRDALYVNLFVGGTVKVGDVAGTAVEVVQKTDYPWSGKVSITINPADAKRLTVRIRVPSRNVSRLYTVTPADEGLKSLTVNGEAVAAVPEQGYVSIHRVWKPGDRIEFEVPMAVGRTKADPRIVADRGRVALRYGPNVYCIESADQDVESVLADDAPLTAAWRPDLLGGVTVIEGRFTNGKKLLAIPYYARGNRGGRSVVWIKAK